MLDLPGHRERSRASKERVVAALRALQCPITHALPLVPVRAEDGHVYERQNIAEWLEHCRKTGELRNAFGVPLTDGTLTYDVHVEETISALALLPSGSSYLLDDCDVDGVVAVQKAFAKEQDLMAMEHRARTDAEAAYQLLVTVPTLGVRMPAMIRGVQVAVDCLRRDSSGPGAAKCKALLAVIANGAVDVQGLAPGLIRALPAPSDTKSLLRSAHEAGSTLAALVLGRAEDDVDTGLAYFQDARTASIDDYFKGDSEWKKRYDVALSEYQDALHLARERPGPAGQEAVRAAWEALDEAW